MTVLCKLPYNLRNYKKYVTYSLLFLFLCMFIRLCSISFHINYKDVIPGLKLFYYNDTKSYIPPKYILAWDGNYLIFNNHGKQIFPDLQCKINNCIFTENRDLLDGDHTKFDALLFSESALLPTAVLPERRSKSQIYIFTTLESAYYWPACELHNDNFFNWTFTYRLNSDVRWSYFIVRNVMGHTVAPSMHVEWQKSIDPIVPSIQVILHHKTKAVAWLVSHCSADSLRDEYISRLQEHLFHFSLRIDVYGECSHIKCTDENCEEMLTKDYYFYLAFENSFSEDYVTEKVLHGYHNYVVPIVYGGANYSRFLPSGSYINAREMHPYNLAYAIHEAMNDPTKYEEYFIWTNTYTFDDDLPGYHPLCDLCKALHSNKAQKIKTYKRFRTWWNGLNGMKWCLPEEYWNETSLVNVDGRHVFDIY